MAVNFNSVKTISQDSLGSARIRQHSSGIIQTFRAGWSRRFRDAMQPGQTFVALEGLGRVTPPLEFCLL